MAALRDPSVAEVLLNPDGSLWIDVVGKGLQFTGYTMEAGTAEERVDHLCQHAADHRPVTDTMQDQRVRRAATVELLLKAPSAAAAPRAGRRSQSPR